MFNNISLLLVCIWLCFSCSGTKHIQTAKPLLKSNDFSFKSEEKIPNKSYLEYELSTICKQKPNKKFLLLIPRQRFYQAGLDSTRLFHKIYRRMGEVPTLLDSALTAKSAQEMRYYLQDKGYYEADVRTKIDTSRNRKKTYVQYEILPKRLYRVDTTIFTSRDTVIQRFIAPLSATSLLKPGQAVSLELYNAEVDRITKYLRNNGFNFFRRNYISQLRGDSSDFKVKLRLEIFPPSEEAMHQQYRIGKVFVQPNYNPLEIVELKDSLIENIHFLIDKDLYSFKPEVLLNKITIAAGQLYKREEETQTYNNLGALSSIKFISMKQEIDPDNPNLINYRILLTRNKRYDFTADLEGSYSDRNIVDRVLVGAALNFSLRTRSSPLRGGALLTNSIQGGVEFAVPKLDIFTVDVGFQNQLSIPRFVDYFGIWRGISRGKKRPEGLYRFLKEQVNTRITGNATYLQLRNLYTYLLFNASFGYDIELFERDRLVINHVGVDYLSPDIKPQFRVVLENNPFLQRSFGQQLFTGFLVRDLNYFYNRKNRSGETYSVRFGFEISGLEVTTLNSIYNQFSLQPTTFKIGEIDFARYAKLEIDARYTKNYTPTRALAARFNIGVASPYGQATEVPYVKQFYIGGPNSIRAFRARQIGPGSYCSSDVFPEICPNPDIPVLDSLTAYYQTGDMKLEFNLEYRFLLGKLGGYKQEGAFFLDVGNVWTLRNDSERPNSQFRFSADPKQALNNAFYNQLAIGTGFGMRFDFSFFLLRLDLGYPLRTPYNPENPWVRSLKWRDTNFNLAIDYPF